MLVARAFAVLLIVSLARAAAPTKQDCVSANEAGQDLRRSGKLHTARERFATFVAASCPPAVREDCAERLREVEKATASVVFEVKDSSGNDLSAVRVSVDGEQIATKLDGTAIDVDLGEHTIRFEADGKAIDKKFLIREGERDRHESVTLGARSTSKPIDGKTMSRVPAIIAFSAGGVGLIVGIAFTGAFVSEPCATSACDLQGDARSAQQSKLAGYSAGIAVGFIVAGLGAITGTILLLTSSSPTKASAVYLRPQIGLGWTGVEGRFM